MLIFLFVLAFFGLFIVVPLAFWQRLSRLERENEGRAQELRWVRDRVLTLERQIAGSATMPVPAAPPVAPPILEPVAVLVTPAAPIPEAAPASEPVIKPVAPPPLPPPLPVPRDWEALIGGNWLNKLGVLIVVVGIALFVGYSLTQMGPAGRVAIGLATGVALLATGLGLERRPGYDIFARGLTAGGWAVIYFTAYAVHAIPAARVVENPLLGFVLLLSAAATLVVFSLRYGSETVTGVAYFAAFAALLLAPRTDLTLPASIPLAASLLFVAWRWNWPRLAAGGAVFTYLAFAFSMPRQEMWLVLWVYWLMFEAFDLTVLRSTERSLFPISASGFILCSLLIWGPGRPAFDLYLGAASFAFLLSAIARGRLRPTGEDIEQLFDGGYSLAAAFSAAVAAYALLLRFHGDDVTLLLLLEAEMIVLTGRFLNLRFLRWLGAAALAAPLLSLAVQISIAGFGGTHPWVTSAVLLACTLYLDRALLPSWAASSYAATAVVAVILIAVTNATWLGLTWMAWAASLLFITWIAESLADLRPAGWLLGAAGVLVLAIGAGLDEAHGIRWEEWTALFIGGALAYAIMTQEKHLAAYGALASGALLVALGLVRLLPEPWVGLGWLLLAAAHILVAWVLPAFTAFPVAARVLGALALLVLSFVNGLGAAERAVPYEFWFPLFLASALVFAVSLREPAPVAPVLIWSGALLLVLGLNRLLADSRGLTVAWGLEGIALLGAGFALASRHYRLSGLAVFALCILRLFLIDFSSLDTVSRILSFVLLGLLLLGGSWLYTRYRENINRYL